MLIKILIVRILSHFCNLLDDSDSPKFYLNSFQIKPPANPFWPKNVVPLADKNQN